MYILNTKHQYLYLNF